MLLGLVAPHKEGPADLFLAKGKDSFFLGWRVGPETAWTYFMYVLIPGGVAGGSTTAQLDPLVFREGPVLSPLAALPFCLLVSICVLLTRPYRAPLGILCGIWENMEKNDLEFEGIYGSILDRQFKKTCKLTGN